MRQLANTVVGVEIVQCTYSFREAERSYRRIALVAIGLANRVERVGVMRGLNLKRAPAMLAFEPVKLLPDVFGIFMTGIRPMIHYIARAQDEFGLRERIALT